MENVKVKDLEVGHIYVTSLSLLGTNVEGWRRTYLYLGRNKKTNQFIYLFIGSLSDVNKYDEKEIYNLVNLYATTGSSSNFEVTKSNKKLYKMKTYSEFNSFQLDINSSYLDNIVKETIYFYLNQLLY